VLFNSDAAVTLYDLTTLWKRGSSFPTITGEDERCTRKRQSIAKFPYLHTFDTGPRRAGCGLTSQLRGATAQFGRSLIEP
jgi:hypothetical protein